MLLFKISYYFLKRFAFFRFDFIAVGISDCDKESNFFKTRNTEFFFELFLIEGAEYAGSETEFGGFKAEVFDCEAYVILTEILECYLMYPCRNISMFLGDNNESVCGIYPLVEIFEFCEFGNRRDGFGSMGNIKMIGLGVAGGRSKACSVYAGDDFFVFNFFIGKTAAALTLVKKPIEICHKGIILSFNLIIFYHN